MTRELLEKKLTDYGIYADVSEDKTYFYINIEWGDWKHDHLYLHYLMIDLNLEYESHRVTEENGSDCYSAIYKYYKKN